MKRPSFQFYPGDWRRDPGVQALTFHDRGVWIELLCIMHESSERGVLILNGKPMTEDVIARVIGLDKQILTTTLSALLDFGVIRLRVNDGAFYSKRMVEDEKLTEIRRNAGKQGGNPVLLNQKPTTPLNQKPTPSSSSSSSVVNIPPNPLTGETGGDASQTESFQLDADQQQQQQPASKPKAKREPAQDMPSIPEALNTQAFRSAWDDFTAHRKSIRKPLSPKAAELNLKKCLELGPDTACNSIEQSIANGWTGIFEPKAAAPGINGSKPKRDPRVPAHIPDHQAQMWILHQETNCYKQFFGDLHANRDVD